MNESYTTLQDGTLSKISDVKDELNQNINQIQNDLSNDIVSSWTDMFDRLDKLRNKVYNQITLLIILNAINFGICCYLLLR